MTTKFLKIGRLALLLGLGLCTTSQIYAGGGGGGGGGRGGGGGGGGFGGGGGGGGFGGGGAGGAGATSTRSYPNATSPGPVSVDIDPETGSLVVLTDDSTFTNLQELIRQVDQPKPQVLVKVVFLEVTHDDALDFGIEGSYNHVPTGNAIVSNLLVGPTGSLITNFNNSTPTYTGVGPNYGLLAQGATGSQIGGSTMPNGALLASMVGDDYSATIRAVASRNNADILSRPSIVVRNNQPATIQLGQSVPIITSVTYSQNGQPIVNPSYQGVGIILQVTPFIKADGKEVEMIVNPQISALSSASVQIAPGYAAPVIDIRSASTVVVAPDGETIVIGGLMENDKAAVDTKIPVLGDIPLLGTLFKRTQRDHLKRELIIFLTPHIIKTPSMLAAVTTDAEKNEMARRAYSEKELNDAFDKISSHQSSSSGRR